MFFILILLGLLLESDAEGHASALIGDYGLRQNLVVLVKLVIIGIESREMADFASSMSFCAVSSDSEMIE